MHGQHLGRAAGGVQLFAQQRGVIIQIGLLNAFALAAVARLHPQKPQGGGVAQHLQRGVFPRQGQHLGKIAANGGAFARNGPEDGGHVHALLPGRLMQRFLLNFARFPVPGPQRGGRVGLEGLIMADAMAAGIAAGNQGGVDGVGEGGINRAHVIAENAPGL